MTRRVVIEPGESLGWVARFEGFGKQECGLGTCAGELDDVLREIGKALGDPDVDMLHHAVGRVEELHAEAEQAKRVANGLAMKAAGDRGERDALQAEVDTLKAELSAATAERDALKEAVIGPEPNTATRFFTGPVTTVRFLTDEDVAARLDELDRKVDTLLRDRKQPSAARNGDGPGQPC